MISQKPPSPIKEVEETQKVTTKNARHLRSSFIYQPTHPSTSVHVHTTLHTTAQHTRVPYSASTDPQTLHLPTIFLRPSLPSLHLPTTLTAHTLTYSQTYEPPNPLPTYLLIYLSTPVHTYKSVNLFTYTSDRLYTDLLTI